MSDITKAKCVLDKFGNIFSYYKEIWLLFHLKSFFVEIFFGGVGVLNF